MTDISLSTKLLLLFFLGMLLNACQIRSIQPDASEANPTELLQDKPSQKIDEALQPSLSTDLLYDYLVGEIGARADALEIALQHYMKVIQKVRDVYAAERATRIALHIQDYKTGLVAVNTWLFLDAESFSAHQLAGILHLRLGQLAQAQNQFETLLNLASDQQESGLLLIAGVLKEEPNDAAVLQLMRNMLDKYTQYAEAYYAFGVVAAEQQKPFESEQSLREAIVLKPDWPLPHVLLSEVLVAQNKRKQALQHLEQVVRNLPTETVLRQAYVRQLIEAESYDKALSELRYLHQQDASNMRIRYSLAVLLTQKKNWVDARKLWQDLRNAPQLHAEATYFLAQTEEAVGQTDLAIGLYQSVPQGERYVDARVRLSWLLVKSNQLDRALEQLDMLRKQYPQRSADIYLVEAQILAEENSAPETVLACYAEALSAFPSNNDLQYSRGLYLAEQKHYQEMEADFSAVLKRDNEHVEALNALGYTLADRGIRLAESLDYIRRALTLRPNNAVILDSMGWVQYRLGNLQAAEAHLRQALALMQDDEIAAHLGEVLWVQGKYAEARKVWQEALIHKPGSELIPAVLQKLGVSL